MRNLPIAALLAALAPAAGAAEKIKDPAAGWDHLWFKVLVDITVIGIVFALITAFFVIRYRRRSAGEVGSAGKLSAAAAVGWTVVPMFVFMADDFFLAATGWQLWNVYRQPPAERLEIKLESGMYSWDYTYPNGVRVQNELKVPAGKPVLLRMTSRHPQPFHPGLPRQGGLNAGARDIYVVLPAKAGRAHRHLRRVLRHHAFLHGRQGDRRAGSGIRRLVRQ